MSTFGKKENCHLSKRLLGKRVGVDGGQLVKGERDVVQLVRLGYDWGGQVGGFVKKGGERGVTETWW